MNTETYQYCKTCNIWFLAVHGHSHDTYQRNDIVTDCRPFADKLRGRNIKSGPHWPLLGRFVWLFDEVVKLRAENEALKKLVQEAR